MTTLRLATTGLVSLVLCSLTSLPHAASADQEDTEIQRALEQVGIDRTPPLAKKLSGRIAFSAEIGKRSVLLVLDLNSGRVRPLVTDASNNTYPAWSPDGRLLAFVSDRDGNKEIYISDWRGEEQRRLTTYAGDDDAPDWAPDGRKIAFSRAQPGSSNANIYTIPTEGGSASAVTKLAGRNLIPRWGPGADQITYTTDRNWPGWDVCIWDLSRSVESCPLTGSDPFCRARWSSNGEHMVFSYKRGQQGVNVGEYTLADRSLRPLTALPGDEYDATFSPDGTAVAFSVETPGRTYGIGLVDREERKPILLLSAPFPVRYLSWTSRRTLELEAERLRAARLASEKAEAERRAAEQAARAEQAEAGIAGTDNPSTGAEPPADAPKDEATPPASSSLEEGAAPH